METKTPTAKEPRKPRAYKIADDPFEKAVERAAKLNKGKPRKEKIFLTNMVEDIITDFGKGKNIRAVKWTDEGLWDYLVKKLKPLDDNNETARAIYNYITK